MRVDGVTCGRGWAWGPEKILERFWAMGLIGLGVRLDMEPGVGPAVGLNTRGNGGGAKAGVFESGLGLRIG